jgi:hypothetical protein
LSPDVFADADARRRNNCWGFLSYRYKTKASILSLAPWNGKKYVRYFEGSQRNCNSGAQTTAFKNATFFPNHWGVVQAFSLPETLYEFTAVSSPLMVDVGEQNNLFPYHSRALKTSKIPSVVSKSTRYQSSVKLGQSKFASNKLYIYDFEMLLSCGLGEEGLNVA